MILDFLYKVWENIVISATNFIPPAPLFFTEAMGFLEQGGVVVGEVAAKFGTVLPFDAFTTVAILWLGAFGYFLSLTGLRIALGFFIK